jgi:hypothetical protein
MRCPICKSEKFGDFRGRKNARCQGCGGFERSRLLWLVLEALSIHEISLPFFHFAPEIGIAKRLYDYLGAKYRPFDFDPDIYAKGGVTAERFDLCQDLIKISPNSVGAICHVHVLEHVRCNAAFVLKGLNDKLCVGGYHVMGVPFFSKRYREDLSEELTAEDRLEKFGHEDHVRSFGTDDFSLMFAPAFEGMQKVSLRDLIPSKLFEEANIPSRALSENNTHEIMIWKKIN